MRSPTADRPAVHSSWELDVLYDSLTVVEHV
jgi:hypothetical protein